MCVLTMFSKTDSFIEYSKKAQIPVFSVYNKGDKRNENKIFKMNRISFDVSKADWYDLDKQIDEALLFLRKYFHELLEIYSSINVYQKYLSFPILSRIDEDIKNQNVYFPIDIIEVAGQLKLGIQTSIYDSKYLNQTNKSDFNKLRNMHDKNE